jgi:hypothetical protein
MSFKRQQKGLAKALVDAFRHNRFESLLVGDAAGTSSSFVMPSVLSVRVLTDGSGRGREGRSADTIALLSDRSTPRLVSRCSRPYCLQRSRRRGERHCLHRTSCIPYSMMRWRGHWNGLMTFG